MEPSMNGNNSNGGLYEYYRLLKKKNHYISVKPQMFISHWKPNSLMWVFSVISAFSLLGDAGTQTCSLCCL